VIIRGKKSTTACPPKLQRRREHLIFWPTAIAGALLDVAGKKAVFAWLNTKQDLSVSVIDGFLRLVMTQNPGAAFGIAPGRRGMLIAVSIVAMITVTAVFLFARPTKKLAIAALGLFAAGVLGNLYDRLFNNGMVRDFIDVYYGDWHWPAFNLADAMLCIAVVLLIFSTAFSQPGPANRPGQGPLRQQK